MSILQLPPAKLAPPAGDPRSPNGTGGHGVEPEEPFAAILDGQRGLVDERGRVDDARGDDDDSGMRSATGEDATDSAAIAAASAVVAAASPADVSATGIAPAPAATDASPTLVSGEPVAPVSPAAPIDALTAMPAATDGSAAAGASSGPAPVAAPPADASVATPSPSGGLVAATGSAGTAIAAPESGGANPQSVAPRATPVHQGTPNDSLPDGPRDEASTSASSSAPVVDGARPTSSSVAVTAPAAEAQPQASASPTGPAAAPPVASERLDGAAPANVPLARAVGLDRAVETVRLALRAAADRGVTHARISLNPRELGGIEIHLRHTPEGLVARVVAEHAGAAQLLQHAGGELRRTLEAQGVTLLQLDIGASADQGGRAAGEQRGFGETGARRDTGSAARDDGDAPLDGAADASAPDSTLALANGVLVDVLA